MTWLNLVSFLHGLGVFGSFTILPVYMRDLGGTDFLVSLSMALFYLLRGSLNFLSGPLSDSSGRRKLITLALALFSLSHVCYALSRTPTAILASIALQATAAGLYWPVAFALVSGLSGPGEGPHNISRFLLALGVGGVAGSWLGGIVADAYSPKATFWLGAAILAVACGTFGLLVPEGRNPGGGRFRLRDVLSVPSEVRLPSLLAAGASIVWAVFSVGMPLWLRDLGASYSFIGGTRAVASGANLGVVASAPFIIGHSGFRTSLSSYLLLCGLTMVGILRPVRLRRALLRLLGRGRDGGRGLDLTCGGQVARGEGGGVHGHAQGPQGHVHPRVPLSLRSPNTVGGHEARLRVRGLRPPGTFNDCMGTFKA